MKPFLLFLFLFSTSLKAQFFPLDSTFGNDGITTLLDGTKSYANAVTLLPDNKLLLTGFVRDTTQNDFLLARFLSNGQLDNSFGDNGIVVTDFMGQSEIPFASVLIAGLLKNNNIFQGALSRYLTDFSVGIVDFSLAKKRLIYPNPIISEATFEYSLLQDEMVSLQLYTLSGKCIQTFFTNQKQAQGAHREQLIIDSSIPQGNYILQLSNDVGSVSVMIMKE